MARKPEYDRERRVIEKQIVGKATENQNFTVPGIEALEEDRPVANVTTSLTQLMRDLLQARKRSICQFVNWVSDSAIRFTIHVSRKPRSQICPLAPDP